MDTRSVRCCPPLLNDSVPDPGEKKSPDAFAASTHYATSIRQPGNRDDANDLVPALLVKMPGATDLLKGRPLVIRQGDMVRLYSDNTPPGGQQLQGNEPLNNVVYVELNHGEHGEQGEKGDSLFRKIIAAAKGSDPSAIDDETVALWRGKIADFVLNKPQLAEAENQALEQDPLHCLSTDDAMAVYNSPVHACSQRQNPQHTEFIFRPQPAYPWLAPLICLLAREVPAILGGAFNYATGEPIVGPLPPREAKLTAIAGYSFRNYINNHNNLDAFITVFDQVLKQAEARAVFTQDREQQLEQGKHISRQLKQALETGSMITEEGCASLQSFIDQHIRYCRELSDTFTWPEPATPSWSARSGGQDSNAYRPGEHDNGRAPTEPATTQPAAAAASKNPLIISRPSDNGQPGLFPWLRQGLDTLWNLLPGDPLTLPVVAGEITSGQANPAFEVSSAPPDGAVNDTMVTTMPDLRSRPIERSSTLLHDPARNLPPYDQNNPGITASEEQFEDARLLMGLLQLQYDDLADYDRPMDFAPVQSTGPDNTTVIDYQLINLADELSAGQLNDLALPNPHNPGGQSRARALGEINCYLAPLLVRVLYPDQFTADIPPSNMTINQFADNFYRRVPGQGMQLRSQELTYQEVITGQLRDRECAGVIHRLQRQGVTTLTLPVMADQYRDTRYHFRWDPVDEAVNEQPVTEPSARRLKASDDGSGKHLKAVPLDVSDPNQVVTIPVTSWQTMALASLSDDQQALLQAYLPSLQETTACRSVAGYMPVTDQIRNNPYLLSYVNDMVLLTALSHHLYQYPGVLPDFYQVLTILLIDTDGEGPVPDALAKAFQPEFRQLCKQHRRIVPELPRDDMKDYLKMLRARTGWRDLTLHNKIWVMDTRNDLHLLIPYQLSEVFSGALTGYESWQLILPPELEPDFRRQWVADNIAAHVRFYQPPEAVSHSDARSATHSALLPGATAASATVAAITQSPSGMSVSPTADAESPDLSEAQNWMEDDQSVPGDGEALLTTEASLPAASMPIPDSTATPVISDIINNRPELLAFINRIIERIRRFSYPASRKEQYLRLKMLMKQEVINKQKAVFSWGHNKEDLSAFMREYRQLVTQHIQARPHLNVPDPWEPRNYLEILSNGGSDGISLQDRVWVKHPYNGLDLLLSYTVSDVLAGALSRYHQNQLILPELLEYLRQDLIHPRFPDIIQQAWMHLRQYGGSLYNHLHNYLQSFRTKTAQEEIRHVMELTTIRDDQLQNYLTLLQSTCQSDELRLSDRVWVRVEDRYIAGSRNKGITLLPGYQLRHVLSGVLASYAPEQLMVIPPALQPHRELMTRTDFTEHLQQAWETYCDRESIQTNQAPTAILQGCLHLEENYRDNRFIRTTLQTIINGMYEYEPNLLDSVFSRLAMKKGTSRYPDTQLQTYRQQYEADCANKKDLIQMLHRIRTDQFHSSSIIQRSTEALQGMLALVQPEDTNHEPLTLEDRIWLMSSDNGGVSLLVSFSLQEALEGTLAGIAMTSLLVPPALEENLWLLTMENIEEILYDIYRVNAVGMLRTPITETLNNLAFPMIVVEKKFQELAKKAGVTNVELTTIIGIFILGEYTTGGYNVNGKPPETTYIKMNYTPYHLFMNTGKVKVPDSPEMVYRELHLLPKFDNSKTRKLFDSIITTDIMSVFDSSIDEAKNSQFIANLTEVLNKNWELYPPPFNAGDEYQLAFDSVDDPVIHHPFITIGYDNQDHSGTRSMCLYSYLTGQQQTVTDFSEFETRMANETSNEFLWVSANGGAAMMHYFENYDVMLKQPFQKKAFIQDAPDRALSAAQGMMNFQHNSRNEMKLVAIFEMIGILLSPIGAIPVIGDVVDILSVVIMNEVQIALEKERFVKDELRKSSIIDYSVTAGMAIIPGMSMKAGKILLQGVRKALGSTKKAVGSLSDAIPDGRTINRMNNIDVGNVPGRTKSKTPDGQRNWPVDAQGHRKPPPIEEDSRDFATYCSPSAQTGRTRRAPRSRSARPCKPETIFKANYLSFITRKEGHGPVLHYFDNYNAHICSFCRRADDSYCKSLEKPKVFSIQKRHSKTL